MKLRPKNTLTPQLLQADSGDKDDWLSNNTICYILVKPDVSRAAIQGHVDETIGTYLYKQLEDMLHTSARDMEHQGALISGIP